MSWLALLKIMLEVIIVGIIGPAGQDDHVDPTLVHLVKGKRDSSDDFMKPPVKKVKVFKQKTQDVPIGHHQTPLVGCKTVVTTRSPLQPSQLNIRQTAVLFPARNHLAVLSEYQKP